MKLILIWPSAEPETKIIIDALVDDGHEIAYWVNERGSEQYAPAGTIVHDFYDAWDGKPAPALAEEMFEPLIAADIDQHYRLESIILTMMNKHYDSAPVDERKQMYYDMFVYWRGVLDRMQPDAIVYELIPHSIYTYILYELARARGIKTIMFEDTTFLGRCIHYKDFWSGSDELRVALRKNLEKGVTVEDLGEEIREYWHAQVEERDRTAVWYMQEQKKAVTGQGLLQIRLRALGRSLKEGTVFSLVFLFIARKFQKNLRSEYTSVMRAGDFTRPFVYFPLSFQPERTTSPQGGVYNDQILAAQTVAAALPPGWELYIKEHPSQWLIRTKTRYSSARFRGYYERLAQIPRVRVIPIDTNTYRLTEESQTVAVITGTAGWEALLRGKSALVFGLPWYRDCSGLYPVASVADCKAAFKNIASGARATKQELLAYFKSFEETSIRTHIYQPSDKRWYLTVAQSYQNMIGDILVQLKKMV